MSVPLDRLYHYLKSLINRNVIIYRWTPHGSRNLLDLSQLHVVADIDEIVCPSIIMHDQESLWYNFYDRTQILPRKIKKYQIEPFVINHKAIELWEKLHLRSVLSPSLFPVTIVHSEKNSLEVQKYQENGYLTCYYWAHGVIARDWYRFAQYDRMLKFNSDSIDKDFLIYNRDWSGTREYRLKFTEMLIENSLVNFCQTKFSPVCNQIDYRSHVFNNKNLQISREDLEHFFENNLSLPTSSANYCSEDYNRIAIEIVLETVFDDTRWHLTEKSLRPIACGKPFLLAASSGSLEYLKQYGFQTFAPLIDESYDLIKDPKERLQAIVTEMSRIQRLPAEQKRKLFENLHSIAARNQERFFSEKFLQDIIEEFSNNIHISMDQCTRLISLDSVNRRLANQEFSMPSSYRNLCKIYTQIESIFLDLSK